MKELLTQTEIERTRQLCFTSPAKACAIAQLIADTCQVVSCATYAGLKGKSPRAVQYNATRLTGIEIENRRFISVNQ